MSGDEQPLGAGGVYSVASKRPAVPERVDSSDPDGVDYTWVMQVTFILSLAVGVPVIAGLSIFVSLPTWGQRATFAVQVGAVIWLAIALLVFGYAKRVRS